MKKTILALIIIISITSCKTAQQHINSAKKHTEKAIMKGAVITNNDVQPETIYTSDTIIKNDTVFITNNIIETVPGEKEIRYITKRDKKRELQLEKQHLKDSISIEKLKIRKYPKAIAKITKQENKTQRAVNKNGKSNDKWWLFMILGFVICLVIILILKQVTYGKNK